MHIYFINLPESLYLVLCHAVSQNDKKEQKTRRNNLVSSHFGSTDRGSELTYTCKISLDLA